MNMSTQNVHAKRLSTFDGGVLIVSAVIALVGGLFAAEGLLGYFYNSSMFLEGLDHITEIYSGLAVAVVGVLVAAYLWLRR
jgi:hypothetical protein